MTSETIDAFRGATYEVAEAIAPTWERRRAEIEEVSTPVREWILHVLQPREGDTGGGYELPGVALCAVAR